MRHIFVRLIPIVTLSLAGSLLGGLAALRSGTKEPDRLINRHRESALKIAPTGDLKGLVPRDELQEALVCVLPRWPVRKTNALLHAIRLWGTSLDTQGADPLEIYPGQPILSGAEMLELLLSERKYLEWRVLPGPFLYRSTVGVGVLTRSGGGVAHCDQFLKVMGELGLPADTRIEFGEGDHATLGDVVRQSLNDFSVTEELEFTAVAYRLSGNASSP